MGAQDISIFEQNNSQLKNQSTQKQETVDFNAIKNAQIAILVFIPQNQTKQIKK